MRLAQGKFLWFDTLSIINHLSDVDTQINRMHQKPGLKCCDENNDKSLIIIVKDCLCSIAKIIETKKDENDCLIKTKAHVNASKDSEETSKSLASFARTHLTTSFIPK